MSFFRKTIKKQDYYSELNQIKREVFNSEWTLFDDDKLTSMDSLEDVIRYCVDTCCYPTVILFEKLNADD